MNETPNIVKALGLEHLPVEDQDFFMEQFGDVLFRSLINQSVPLLSEENQELFNDFLDQPETDLPGILYFLEENVPNFNKILGDIVAEHLQELETVASIR